MFLSYPLTSTQKFALKMVVYVVFDYGFLLSVLIVFFLELIVYFLLQSVRTKRVEKKRGILGKWKSRIVGELL